MKTQSYWLYRSCLLLLRIASSAWPSIGINSMLHLLLKCISINSITYRKSYERDWISWYMGTSDAFEVVASVIWELRKHHNILNKIIKKEKKRRPSRFYGHATVMASKLLTCYLWAANSITVTKKTSLKLFRNTSFIQIKSSGNWEKVQYRNSVLHSITCLYFRHWPIRNEIFCWEYYNYDYYLGRLFLLYVYRMRLGSVCRKK